MFAGGARVHPSYARIDNMFDEKLPLFFPTANCDRIGRYFKVGARIKM